MGKTLQKVVLASWFTATALTGVYAGKQFENYLWEKESQKIARIENKEDRELQLKMHNYTKNHKAGKFVRNGIFGVGGAGLGLSMGALVAYFLTKKYNKN